MVFQFEYPGRLLPKFIETAGLDFRGDRSVPPKEIWHFMTIEAPRRFPYAFSTSSYHINRLSSDVEFLSGIKRGYLTLSLYDRLTVAELGRLEALEQSQNRVESFIEMLR